MPPARPRILYVTDLAYQARGRRYCDEDIFLTSRLRDDFDLALCHPRDAAALMDAFDAVVVRNSGPVLTHQDAYDDFRSRALAAGTRVYNPLSGRADMAGKQYLLDLTAAGYPVIPTVARAEDLHLLLRSDRYVVKPELGADSIGLRIVSAEGVRESADGRVLIQPCVDFAYEVSFYFVDHDFQYALHAPHTDRRWQLERYEPTDADLDFARRFIEWNGLGHGIQRVDACRAPGGELLLVELEDLNPYLSLDALDDTRRDGFVAAMKASLHRFLAAEL
ncbi:hypothetical protein J7F01_33110 [Streptomyces sp. ISL-22]|uniref:hypothetical protein n=1 Tax=unclassified Streptomyces TaxID=2593676 RepID=UPI001BEC04DF|nr:MULTISPECIES: hypothetical protein [unclassified Streptomyces]MBT2419416.1 hypothetical protein [Streptomyces sp. ISL-24]MBT2436912.1 hypothetical protein [Streptomyces sp. ISL-22]